MIALRQRLRLRFFLLVESKLHNLFDRDRFSAQAPAPEPKSDGAEAEAGLISSAPLTVTTISKLESKVKNNGRKRSS